ncbi:hypothetical protein V8C43DRAFT_300191 [Trichoderma afarasin]
MLGFLGMDEERLEFDPTIRTSDGKRLMEIKRDGRPERLIIDESLHDLAVLLEGTYRGRLADGLRHQGFMAILGAGRRGRDSSKGYPTKRDNRRSVLSSRDVATAATTDAVAALDSTAATVMANAAATATADSTVIAAVVGKASTDDQVASTTATTTIARRASASPISTASTIAVAAPRRRRSTAQQGEKTPRVQQLR